MNAFTKWLYGDGLKEMKSDKGLTKIQIASITCNAVVDKVLTKIDEEVGNVAIGKHLSEDTLLELRQYVASLRSDSLTEV